MVLQENEIKMKDFTKLSFIYETIIEYIEVQLLIFLIKYRRQHTMQMAAYHLSL